jgi:adhesin HecA-like repeat protein
MKVYGGTMKTMPPFKNEEGQTFVIAAFCMVVMFGFLALALDVGLMFNARHRVQTAADAAAIAGAIELGYHGSTNVTSVARAAAGLNGITDTTHQVVVNNPTTHGYHTGAGYVEVVITQPNPTVFMSGLFGRNIMNVSARAVGGVPPSATCMYILDNNPSDVDVLYTKKTITSKDCGVQVNSPNPDAVCLHGSGTIDSDYLHIVGGLDTSRGCKSSKNAPMQSGVAPVADPFNNLEGPIPATACTAGNTTASTTISSVSQLPTPTANPDGILSDQVYCFSGTNVSLDGGSTNLVLGPGVYVFENGVNIGNVTVNGGTLDNAGGVYAQKNDDLAVTAPTSGIYNGIALMQPSINTDGGTCSVSTTPCSMQVQFGSGTSTLNGIIYAPTSLVTLHDNGGKNWTAAGIIAWQLSSTDDITITGNYNYANSSTTPLKKITLVE